MLPSLPRGREMLGLLLAARWQGSRVLLKLRAEPACAARTKRPRVREFRLFAEIAKTPKGNAEQFSRTASIEQDWRSHPRMLRSLGRPADPVRRSQA